MVYTTTTATNHADNQTKTHTHNPNLTIFKKLINKNQLYLHTIKTKNA